MTEAGFGADLGAEKFLDIKCRKSNIKPDCVVLVATIRALKMHGNVQKDDLKKENISALKNGLVNLERHITNIRKFGLPVTVAINHFTSDTQNEVDVVLDFCKTQGVKASMCTHWSDGGAGATELAQNVTEICEENKNTFLSLIHI